MDDTFVGTGLLRGYARNDDGAVVRQVVVSYGLSLEIPVNQKIITEIAYMVEKISTMW